MFNAHWEERFLDADYVCSLQTEWDFCTATRWLRVFTADSLWPRRDAWFCHLYKIGRGFLLFFPSLSGRLNTLGTPLVQFLTLFYAFSSQAMLAEWNCNIISSAQAAAYIMGSPLLVFSGSSIRVINWVWWLILAEIQASTISYEPRGTFYSICVWHCHSRKRAS